MQGAALGALESLGDPTNSEAILHYYSRHPGQLSADALTALGELGDPPGSAAVRERLVAEANNKRNNFDLRYGAALGLKAMGQESLVKPILDIEKAKVTNDNMIVIRGAMLRLAATRGVTIKAKSDVDALLRDISVRPRTRADEWGRPLRVEFASQGVFHVVSDGPDMTADTTDDMSTAEAYDAYIDRVFPGVF